jgi:hypothetical protein
MSMVLLTLGVSFASAIVSAKVAYYNPKVETVKVIPVKEISVVQPKLEVKVEMPVVKNHSTF